MAEPGRRETDGLPEAAVDARWWRWAQVIWVVPVVAVLVAGWLAAREIMRRGPTVEIAFQTATGLEAGRSSVRYKDVEIGTVTAIGLSEDRQRVVVSARLTPDARDFLVEDTRFWVVRPRIAGGQALGFGTLLTGAYIALDPGESQAQQRRFMGLESPPGVTSDMRGAEFMLRADDMGSLDIGSPVYYRRVRVGQIVAAELDAGGNGVLFRAFVNEPHDRYVTDATRFWNASGIDVSLDVRGLRLETQSLASIVVGGIAFQNLPGADAQRAEPGTRYTLFESREVAMRELPSVRDPYVLRFSQSVRGLSVGAPVDLRGVVIGEVTRIALDYDRKRVELRPAVEIDLFPERLAASLREPGPAYEPGARHAMLQRFVDRGLRAQLRTSNLITGTLYVTLDMFPGQSRAKLDPRQARMEIPTVPGGFEELQASVAAVMKQLEQVPFAEIARDVRTTVAALDETLRRVSALVGRLDAEIAPELKAAISDARGALERAQRVVEPDSPLQGDLRTTLRDVSRAAQAMRDLAEYLERHPESLIRGRR